MPVDVTIVAEEEQAPGRQSDSDFRLRVVPRSEWAALIPSLDTEVVAFIRSGFSANAIFVSRLKQAHRVPWAGVGPAVRLTHPNLESLTRHLRRFGPWDVPATPMAMPHLPEGLTSYKTHFLKELEPATLNEREYELQSRLSGKLFLDPTLEVSHAGGLEGCPAPLPYPIRGHGLSFWDRWRLRYRLFRH